MVSTIVLARLIPFAQMSNVKTNAQMGVKETAETHGTTTGRGAFLLIPLVFVRIIPVAKNKESTNKVKQLLTGLFASLPWYST